MLGGIVGRRGAYSFLNILYLPMANSFQILMGQIDEQFYHSNSVLLISIMNMYEEISKYWNFCSSSRLFGTQHRESSNTKIYRSLIELPNTVKISIVQTLIIQVTIIQSSFVLFTITSLKIPTKMSGPLDF